MDATILEVMESWPLQLSIQARDDVRHVTLSDTVRVILKGDDVGVRALRPGTKIRITSTDKDGAGSGRISLIEIID